MAKLCWHIAWCLLHVPVLVYHLSHNDYITARYFRTIKFGHHNVNITSHSLNCLGFLGGAVIITGDLSLASRKRCDLKTRKRCDFFSAAQKIASDFSAIYSAIFSGDFFLRFFRGKKTCDLVLCDLKTQRFFCDCDFWDAKEI